VNGLWRRKVLVQVNRLHAPVAEDIVIDKPDGTIAVQTIAVQMGEGAEILTDFPGDVPVYPNLRLYASFANTSTVAGDRTFKVLSGWVGDSGGRVARYYRREAVKSGWKFPASPPK
jgi:hypothetical protein